MAPYYDDENGITIYNGDCLEVMKQFEDNSFDLVLTDPPYNINIARWDQIENYLEWLEEVIIECKRVLKKNGSLYLFQGYSYGAETKLLLDKHLIYRNWIIWHRVGRGNYPNWTNSFDFIFFYSQSDDYTFNKLKEKSYLSHKYGFKHLEEHYDPKEDKWYRFRALTNVWTDIKNLVGNNPRKTSHESQKPIELMERIIKASSNKHDMIMDPFVGSGTTLVAAKQLGRAAVGIDISDKYCSIAKQRLSQEYLF